MLMFCTERRSFCRIITSRRPLQISFAADFLVTVALIAPRFFLVAPCFLRLMRLLAFSVAQAFLYRIGLQKNDSLTTKQEHPIKRKLPNRQSKQKRKALRIKAFPHFQINILDAVKIRRLNLQAANIRKGVRRPNPYAFSFRA